MEIKRLPTGRYEAMGTINEVNLKLKDGTIFWVDFIAYGDSFRETIETWFRKVDKYFHPEEYPTIAEAMDDDSDEYKEQLEASEERQRKDYESNRYN